MGILFQVKWLGKPWKTAPAGQGRGLCSNQPSAFSFG